MTDHPLTDEMCEKLSPWYTANLSEYDADLMDEGLRNAYDKGAADRLEQVIQFLEANKDLSVETALRFIRPAMRPQQQENN